MSSIFLLIVDVVTAFLSKIFNFTPLFLTLVEQSLVSLDMQDGII